MTYIYTLSDKTGVRYIGKSNDPITRLKVHLKESKYKRTKKEKWIFSILNKGETPVLEVLEEVLEEDWSFYEMYWIAQFKSWNFDILNGTVGGEGSNGFKGRTHSIETKNKCKEASLKRTTKTSMKGESNGRSKLTIEEVNEIRNKINLGHSRKVISEEYKISKASVTYIKNGKRWNKVL